VCVGITKYKYAPKPFQYNSLKINKSDIQSVANWHTVLLKCMRHVHCYYIVFRESETAS